jgi:mRNA interferase RelE/StbE
VKIWRIEITRTATKQITKLDRRAKEAILQFLRERLSPAENPRQWGRALQGEKRGLWRYRVGDYRLICDIKDEEITVLVLELGHRKTCIDRLTLRASFYRLIVESKVYANVLAPYAPARQYAGRNHPRQRQSAIGRRPL